MDFNITEIRNNVTIIEEVVEFFNISVANFTNESVVSQIHLFDLYEAYKTREKEQLLMYKWIAYFLGSLIIISNLTVVISSGLILKKGQQPKSTYLLLGNVSLADTIIGISIIFGASVNNPIGSNQLCIFQLGMLVCPAMVSIFSVGFIAVDRYIYILHGLYYQRWFNTTRVRIGIVCIWMIGIILGFMPATGWKNTEKISPRCYYVSVYPYSLILFNSIISIIPVIVVTILYSIILIRALKNLRNIKSTEKSVNLDLKTNEKPKLRMNRGNTKTVNKIQIKNNIRKIKRSVSFNECDKIFHKQTKESYRSKSTDDLSKSNDSQVYANKQKPERDSNFSICTIETNCTVDNSLKDVTELPKTFELPCKKSCKVKGKKKWRAVTVVMLTSGSFIVTWMPFFIFVIFFVFCEEKKTNPSCLNFAKLLSGPLATLAFINSVLNPLIYAWWHKGFQKSIRNHFRKYVQRLFFVRDTQNTSRLPTQNTLNSNVNKV